MCRDERRRAGSEPGQGVRRAGNGAIVGERSDEAPAGGDDTVGDGRSARPWDANSSDGESRGASYTSTATARLEPERRRGRAARRADGHEHDLVMQFL
jgi:hypothetical protein